MSRANRVEALDARVRREIEDTQCILRSSEFLQGAVDGARFEMRGLGSGCSYLFGTPQFDAYFAGYEAGRLLALTWLFLERVPEPVSEGPHD